MVSLCYLCAFGPREGRSLKASISKVFKMFVYSSEVKNANNLSS